MRLPGTESWSDADIEAALAFADNLRVATVSIVIAVRDKQLPGGPIAADAWEPTDLVYQLGDAAGLAFATGRVRDGLVIASSLSEIGGPPPRMTLMQTIFAATLGAIAGTITVTMVEDEVNIEMGARRVYVSFDLSDHGLARRRHLFELIIPAAFASPTFLDKIHGLAIGGFDQPYHLPQLDMFARLSPMVRFARDWRRESQMDQRLLLGSLLDYEGYIGILQADKEAWMEMPFRGSLIDWPLLAMLVGMHRWSDTPAENDLVVGPATRFLHDLAREIAAATSPKEEMGAPA